MVSLHYLSGLFLYLCFILDAETAASAVRNLHDNPVGGRPLRVDLAPDDPKTVKQKEREKVSFSGSSPVTYASAPNPLSASNMGMDLPPGQSSLDSISRTLATMPPNQLLDVLAQIKTLVHQESHQVRQLLGANPQLAYALFQAMLMMNLIDNNVLQVRISSNINIFIFFIIL